MKGIIISILIVAVLIGGAIMLSPKNTAVNNPGYSPSANNVTIENGVQIVTLNAKGGYYPRQSLATAGLPTVIRFKTNGTFDCSAAVRIPSLKISKFLPQTGNTDINIGTPSAGPFIGSCGMGMYPFEVDFQ